MHAAAGEAVARARAGDGPTLIEAVTYRWRGHFEGDPQPYRTQDEVTEWKARDPVTLAERVTNASSAFILDRALTSALALPASGAEVAANQWVTSEELGLGADGVVWAGTVVVRMIGAPTDRKKVIVTWALPVFGLRMVRYSSKPGPV